MQKTERSRKRLWVRYLVSVIIITVVGFAAKSFIETYFLYSGSPKILLQFNRCGDGIAPLDHFFEIGVDLDKKVFTRPKPLEGLKAYRDSDYQDGGPKYRVLEVIGDEANVVGLIDVSEDGKWASVRVRVPRPDNSSEYRDEYQIFLLNIESGEIVKKVSLTDSMCFTKDSSSCIFDGIPRLKQVLLSTMEVEPLGKGEAFVMLPGREKLILCKNRSILLADIKGNVERTLGTYFLGARSAGLINDKWAYIVTDYGAKKSRGELYFIRLEDYTVIQYPYRFYESKLVRIKNVAPEQVAATSQPKG